MNSIQSPKSVRNKKAVYSVAVGNAMTTHHNVRVASGTPYASHVATVGGKDTRFRKTNAMQVATLAACVLVSSTGTHAHVTHYIPISTPKIRHDPRALDSELIRYLQSICDSGDVTETAAAQAKVLWLSLQNNMNSHMAIPDAASGPNGEILLTWDKGEHHLELEIVPGATAELFYRNRLSEQLWAEEYELEKPISDSAREKLAFFTL